MSKHNKRVGLGMKPRVAQEKAAEPVQEVSASEGQPEREMEPVSGAVEGTQTGVSLEADLGEKSAETTVAAEVDEKSVVIGLPEPLTPESTLGDGPVSVSTPREKFTGSLDELYSREVIPGIKNRFGPITPGSDFAKGVEQETAGFQEAPEGMDTPPSDAAFARLQQLVGENPVVAEGAKSRFTPSGLIASATIEDIEELIGRVPVHIAPDGQVTAFPIGQRSDGTFGLVVSIPEGLIEPIRQQAESDRVSPEEWVSTRLVEYLESWWSAPQGK